MNADKETVRYLARAWRDTVRKHKPSRGDSSKKRAMRLAAINVMLMDGATLEVVQLVSDLLGRTLVRDWGRGGDLQRFSAKMAAATFEAEHYARVYREKNLDPNKEQRITPAPEAQVARVYAKVMENDGGDYRSQIGELRDDDAYQEQVGALVREMVTTAKVQTK